MTRPDIYRSVQTTSRRVTSPCVEHWPELYYVLYSVTDTVDVDINYKKSAEDDIDFKITATKYKGPNSTHGASFIPFGCWTLA